jgi:hypothetical protein
VPLAAEAAWLRLQAPAARPRSSSLAAVLAALGVPEPVAGESRDTARLLALLTASPGGGSPLRVGAAASFSVWKTEGDALEPEKLSLERVFVDGREVRLWYP